MPIKLIGDIHESTDGSVGGTNTIAFPGMEYNRFTLGDIVNSVLVLEVYVGPSGNWCFTYLRKDGLIRSARQESYFL